MSETEESFFLQTKFAEMMRVESAKTSAALVLSVQQAVVKPSELTEVFLVHFYPEISAELFEPLRFFKHLKNNLVKYLSAHPVFFNLSLAREYCRFRAEGCAVIIHAWLPEMAIAGQHNMLVLKPDQVSLGQIRGCYLNETEFPYYHNPFLPH